MKELDIFLPTGCSVARKLSPFSSYDLRIDKMKCRTIISALASLQFKNTERQYHACSVTGERAIALGKTIAGTLPTIYWKGKKLGLKGEPIKRLINFAFESLFEQKSFIQALIDSADATLVMEQGVPEDLPKEVKWLMDEYLRRLTKKRKELLKEAENESTD